MKLRYTAEAALIFFAFLCMPGYGSYGNDGKSRIVSLRGDIALRQDNAIVVSEHVHLRITADTRSDIYRDFPDEYCDVSGRRFPVDFRIAGIYRNDEPHRYSIEKRRTGFRLYLEREDTFPETGDYLYNIVYTAARHIIPLDDRDELYWYVSGGGYSLPVDSVEVAFVLQDRGSFAGSGFKAHTGISQVWERAQFFSEERAEALYGTLNRGLRAGEQLRLAISLPKGYIEKPAFVMRAGYFVRDNIGTVTAIVGMAILWAYYAGFCARRARDNRIAGVIMRDTPPYNMTAHLMRRIVLNSCDWKALASYVVSLAVRGYLVIHCLTDTYELACARSGHSPAGVDKHIMNEIFRKEDTYIFTQDAGRRIRSALTLLRHHLAADITALYFVLLKAALVTGILISFMCLITVSAFVSVYPLWVTVLWALSGSVAVYVSYFLFLNSVSLWVSAVKSRSINPKFLARCVRDSFTALTVAASGAGAVWAFAHGTTNLYAGLLVLFAAFNILWYHLLRSPRRYGGIVLDHIEGFAMFLKDGLKNRADISVSCANRHTLFEQYLPYAMALNIEESWVGQFQKDTAKSGLEDGSYAPKWYKGRLWQDGASSCRSLSDALSGAMMRAGSIRR